jgi:RNA polymerase sigma-70 factor (ECF subfamily)
VAQIDPAAGAAVTVEALQAMDATDYPAPIPHPWHEWVEEHARAFLLYARQQSRTDEDARDILQDALAEAWGKSPGRLPDRAVVFATIRRRAIDLGRSIDRRQKREIAAHEGRADWFQQDFTAGDTRACLAAAVQELPDDLREVVVLRIWGDLTFPAIAQLTGVPCATATSRYRYALEHLRGHLAELQP